MWLNLASMTFLAILIPYLIWNLTQKSQDYYKLIVISSLSLSSLVLFGKYPIADEVALTVIAGYLLLHFIKNRKELNFRRFSRETLFKFIIIGYFTFNTLISIFTEYSHSKLRFLNIFLSMFVFVAAMKIIHSDNLKIRNIVKKALHVNLYIWITYYLILRFLGIDWNSQQSVTYVGSTYAAFVPALGLVILLLFEKNTTKKNFQREYLFFYGGSVLAWQFYYSRVLGFSLLLTTVIAISIKKNFMSVITLILVFLSAHFISGAIITANYGNEVALQVNNPNVVDIVKETKSSANFIVQPRSSDADRSHQIRCSTKLITSNDKFLIKLFGYGQNNHKKALQACMEEKFGPISPDKVIRPVGYAALITDFGLVGLILVTALFIMTLVKFKSEKGFLLYAVMIFQLAGWSLVTNHLDHSAIYLILFLNLFGQMTREIN